MTVQHMVLLKFRDDVTQETIDQLFVDIAALQQQIAGIAYYAGGPYASPEGLNGGFTHGFLMTFASVEARDRYLPDPQHERVKAAILPLVENAVAFDFEAP